MDCVSIHIGYSVAALIAAFLLGAGVVLPLLRPLAAYSDEYIRNIFSGAVQLLLLVMESGAIFFGLWKALERISNKDEANRIAEAGFLLLSGVMAAAMIATAGSLARNERVSLESKWGSLGSARSGIDMSRPMALIGIVMVCVLGLMVLGYHGKPAEKYTPAPSSGTSVLYIDPRGGVGESR